MIGTYRRITQISVLILVFVIPILNIHEVYGISGTLYAVSIGGLSITDPAVILQTIFAAGEITVLLMTAALFPIFAALMFGRIWCGWLCPYHLLSDAIAGLRSRVFRRAPTAAGEEFPPFRANLRRFAFLALGCAAAAMVGTPLLNYVHAPGILSTEIMILLKERALSIEFLFIVALVALEFTLFPRFWCRMFCPTGAVLSVFRTNLTLRVHAVRNKTGAPCCKETACANACPMRLQPYRDGGDTLCTNCGLCVDACPHARMRFTGFCIGR